jgi:hypothetical protein
MLGAQRSGILKRCQPAALCTSKAEQGSSERDQSGSSAVRKLELLLQHEHLAAPNAEDLLLQRYLHKHIASSRELPACRLAA